MIGFHWRSAASATALLALATGAAVPAQAAPRPGYEFGYFLPRTQIEAQVAQRLVRCPSIGDRDPVIETTVDIGASIKPDPAAFVRLDTRSGFLAKRSTEIKLTPDGMLTAFNGSTEGQGGEILSSVVKVATMVGATLLTGKWAAPAHNENLVESPPHKAPPRLSFSCTPAVQAKVDRRDRLADEVAQLEAQVTNGHDSPAVVELLAARRAALADADDALTIKSAQTAIPVPGQGTGTVLLDPLPGNPWFEGAVPGGITGRPGTSGLQLRWAAVADIAAAMARSGSGFAVPSEPQPYLYYRRPVPVAVTLVSCKSGPDPCEPDLIKGRGPSETAIAGAKKLPVAQISPLFILRLGRGGVFGSRQAEADFDASGTPVRLKYGSSSSAAGATAVVDAAGEGFTTLRGADAAARDRALQKLRDAKERKDLLDALSKQ